jgi:hypothetical protein
MPGSDPYQAALAEAVLQRCLHSLNVRKLPLAVRERRSPEGRGHKGTTAGTDFAYLVSADNYTTILTKRQRKIEG